jgi:hypothetical protein
MAKRKAHDGKYGQYAFLGGVLIALAIGLFPKAMGGYEDYLMILLTLLGVVVGLLNISARETTEFLIASIAVMGGSGIANLGFFGVIGQYVQSILTYVAVFVAPAALVVALKAIYALAEKK